jgi:hypothetical protein
VKLLHIYDSNDWTIRFTATRRGVIDKVAASSVVGDLVPGIDALAAAGARFDKILFETHGSPGAIYFGDEALNAKWIRDNLLTRHYETLCAPETRVYFNGCNVAEGRGGWEFLEAAAELFLRVSGGSVFGQTSVGLANPFNGHVVHPWGDVRTLYVAPGGRIVERFEQ